VSAVAPVIYHDDLVARAQAKPQQQSMKLALALAAVGRTMSWSGTAQLEYGIINRNSGLEIGLDPGNASRG